MKSLWFYCKPIIITFAEAKKKKQPMKIKIIKSIFMRKSIRISISMEYKAPIYWIRQCGQQSMKP